MGIKLYVDNFKVSFSSTEHKLFILLLYYITSREEYANNHNIKKTLRYKCCCWSANILIINRSTPLEASQMVHEGAYEKLIMIKTLKNKYNIYFWKIKCFLLYRHLNQV